MTTPPTIKEDGSRWVIENARPIAMRIVIGFAAPIAVALIGITMINDAHEGRWGMLTVRLVFALFVALAAVFSLFGAERLSIEGSELVWRRGKSQQRRAALGDVEKLERIGNQLRIHLRAQEAPIIIGAGLRQPEPAIAWLAERVKTQLTAAQKGT